MTAHTYRTSLSWSGSTSDYDSYDRATAERVERLLHKAHRQCYIANSLTSEVVLEPIVEVG